uniref:Uncharacterized protein n=1 Tax=viral metagenome TaxID=1070528 RepID=A0A6H1ZG35_9ZZZZ
MPTDDPRGALDNLVTQAKMMAVRAGLIQEQMIRSQVDQEYGTQPKLQNNWINSIKERQPYESERNYFRSNPNVGGMAAEDNAVILNPFSNLSQEQWGNEFLKSPAFNTVENNGDSLRRDGTPKGQGWLGPLKRPDGRVATELSVGVEINGKETDIPTLVPTLDKNEIDFLLNSEVDPKIWKTPTGSKIMRKAYDHAIKRISEGKGPFIEDK